MLILELRGASPIDGASLERHDSAICHQCTASVSCGDFTAGAEVKEVRTQPATKARIVDNRAPYATENSNRLEVRVRTSPEASRPIGDEIASLLSNLKAY
jgi:hypothetical protein